MTPPPFAHVTYDGRMEVVGEGVILTLSVKAHILLAAFPLSEAQKATIMQDIPDGLRAELAGQALTKLDKLAQLAQDWRNAKNGPPSPVGPPEGQPAPTHAPTPKNAAAGRPGPILSEMEGAPSSTPNPEGGGQAGEKYQSDPNPTEDQQDERPERHGRTG